MKTVLTIEHGMYEIEVEFEFEYEPYDPGVRYYADGSGCPPSGDYVEVTDAKVLTIGEITREWLVARGWGVEQLDALFYDIAADSQPGDYIYDALYNEACEDEPDYYDPDEAPEYDYDDGYDPHDWEAVMGDHNLGSIEDD